MGSFSAVKNSQGTTYLLVMLSVVLMGIALSVAAKQWKVVAQREREADLLAKGIEIQQALALYSATTKAGRVIPGEVYPVSLADLTRPPKPFLRKVYLDPIGREEWEYVRAPTGGIMGVRSRSKAPPIKRHDFPPVVRHFDGLPTYRDWVFQHPNVSAAQMPPAFGLTPTPSLPTAGTSTAPPAGSASPSTSQTDTTPSPAAVPPPSE